MNKFNKSLLAASIFAAFGSMTAGVALATDHGDNVIFSDGLNRHDARLTDFFALNRGDKIAFIIDTNPTVGNRGMENGVRSDTQPRPETQLEYVFPTDVAFTANIDNHSDVSFADPVRNFQHGGTVVNPAGIKENFTFTFTFDSANQLQASFKSSDTALRISGFYPTDVKPGELVYVLGSGFKSDETKVKVNGRNVGLRYVVSDNVLVFVAPLNAKTGKVSITTEIEGAGDDEEIKVRVTSTSDLTINGSNNNDDDSEDESGISSGAQALRAIASNTAAVAKVNAGDVSGLADIGLPVKTFAGLRDDPFIRTAQQGRNIAAMAMELPQSLFTHGGQKVLLAWGASTFNSIAGYSSDVAGRSFATMFAPENAVLNRIHPSTHMTALANVTMPCQTPFQQAANFTNPGTTLLSTCAPEERMLKAPDVIIFDTTKAQVFPNGRDLTNDQIDYIAVYDPRVESVRRQEANQAQNVPNFVICVSPTKNDVAHSDAFPYLGLPFTAYPGESGNTGGNCN